jgi:DedD protein
MAIFKSRKAGEDAAPAARQPESIEAMRKRARHRLIGAGVLVLIGVLGFPLLFDTQPRPLAVDIPIEIPDRDKVKPLQPAKPPAAAPAESGVPGPSASTAAKAAAPASVAAAPARETPGPAAVPQSKVEAVTAGKSEAKPEVKSEAKPEAKAEPKAEAKPETKAESKADAKPQSKPETKAVAKADAKAADAGKAKTASEGKTAAAAPSEGRYVVQVGAFADPAKAREARAKVERAGLKTYTHVAETKDGKRIRVRVGPFDTRGEADKAASKIKGLDMPAAILTL